MRSKDELYAEEQAYIKKKLWDMLPLDSNMSITFYDLEKDPEL